MRLTSVPIVPLGIGGCQWALSIDRCRFSLPYVQPDAAERKTMQHLNSHQASVSRVPPHIFAVSPPTPPSVVSIGGSRMGLFALAAVCGLLIVGSFNPENSHTFSSVGLAKAATIPVPVMGAVELETYFHKAGYTLENALKNGKVPPYRVDILPSDLAEMQPPSRGRKLFLQIMLPLVVAANHEIAKERWLLVRLTRNCCSMTPDEENMLRGLSERYGVDWEDLHAKPQEELRTSFQDLAVRVDYVPTVIALAQAGIESGWGSSRFAREGQAVFGQWTTSESHGILPERREPDQTHFVKKFPTLYESVRSYMTNLNRNPAYRTLRRIRADLRRKKRRNSLALLEGLRPYAADGEKYIGLLQGIIKRELADVLALEHR